MAISVGQHTAAASVGAATTVTTSSITTAASGSTIDVFCEVDAGINTPTDNKGNTYVATTALVTNSGISSRRFRCENATGGAGHTVTFTASHSGNLNIFVTEVLGALTASAMDQQASVVDSSSPFTVTSGTTTQAAELALASMAGNSATTPATHAESTGYTVLDQVNTGGPDWTGATAWKVLSATGTQTPSFTEASGTTAGVHIVTYKEAAGGGGDVTVGLTGQALALAAGTLRPDHGLALTGSSLTTAIGTMIPGTSIALTGLLITDGLGTLTPSTAKALSGSAMTLGQGTMVPAFTVPLTGLLITIGQGNLTAPGGGGDVTIALTGQAMAIAQGSLVPTTAKALAGSSLASSSGSLGILISTALLGSALNATTGTLTLGLQKALTGLALSSAVGSLGVGISVRLAGSLVSFGQGAITASGGILPIESAPVRMLTVRWPRWTLESKSRGAVLTTRPRRTLH